MTSFILVTINVGREFGLMGSRCSGKFIVLSSVFLINNLNARAELHRKNKVERQNL